MQTYGQYRPTEFDFAGVFLPHQKHWLVSPVIQTRDSEALELSNFAVALSELGGESETVEVHRFGHWGPGWFEIILIDPSDTARVKVAEEIESSLADYPILCDEDLSRREYESFLDDWDHWAAHDFSGILKSALGLADSTIERLENMPLMRFYIEELNGEIWAGDYISAMQSAARRCTREKLAAFARCNRCAA